MTKSYFKFICMIMVIPQLQGMSATGGGGGGGGGEGSILSAEARRNGLLEKLKITSDSEIEKLVQKHVHFFSGLQSNWLMTRLELNLRKCTICDGVYKKIRSFIKHVEDHKREGMFFKCPNFRCVKKLTTEVQLLEHQATCSRQKKAYTTYPCDICGKLFYQKGDLQWHMRTHEGNFGNCLRNCGVIRQSQRTFYDHKKECVYSLSPDTILIKCATCSMDIAHDRMDFHKKEHATIDKRKKRKLQDIKTEDDNNDSRASKRSKTSVDLNGASIAASAAVAIPAAASNNTIRTVQVVAAAASTGGGGATLALPWIPPMNTFIAPMPSYASMQAAIAVAAASTYGTSQNYEQNNNAIAPASSTNPVSSQYIGLNNVQAASSVNNAGSQAQHMSVALGADGTNQSSNVPHYAVDNDVEDFVSNVMV